MATAVVAALLLAALLALFGRGEVPEVKTAVARAAGEMPADTSVLDASGYVVARRQATVSAKITGKVVEVLIEEGMHVDENAVMARLDDTEAKAQLDLARAQLDAARASLDVFTADEHQAERDFARQQALAAAKATSTQEEEQAGAARDTLRARVENAKEQIKVAEQSVDVAKVQLDNTEVRAPFAGVVVAKAAQPGEMISPISAGGGFTRTGIGTIVDMDSLEIEVDVNESFINRVSAGQPVQATLNAYPDWKIPGKVIAVVPTADRNKATIKVRVAIDVKDPRIVPEMGVRVAFLSTASPGSRTGVWVPNEAVVSPAGRPAVFVYEKGAVTRKDVTLGESTQADRQVTGGLAAGQHVVLSPPPSLENGAAVHATD
ncbi:MAG TPA: efflux RND transporter periplasmic adaptor subunit [Candidatus Binatia bacterium]